MENRADNRRSQKRIEASLPVQLRGADPQGEPFEEFTAAVDVSRRGLSLLTARELPHPPRLNVEHSVGRLSLRK